MNRVFSRKDKKHLFLVSEGRCNRCGCELPKGWEAHHVKRYADGGVTSLTNAMALCRRCHSAIHRGYIVKPRDWQEIAIATFRNKQPKTCFLLEATPGAGKTIFAAFCAQEMLDGGLIDFVLCVVPTTALKGDSDAGFLGDFHKAGVEITTQLRETDNMPRDFHGAVITYAQLPNMVATFQTWAANGKRILFVFDEVHHASDKNIWGAAAESCGRIATKILAMTGTPFRGDGQRISFVRYDDDGVAIADHKYTYQQAVAQSVCRPVLFLHDDGLVDYVIGEAQESVTISEATPDQVGKAAAGIFDSDSVWLSEVLAKADAKLDEYRITDTNAGGLIICRPGSDDEDDRRLFQVAKAFRKITGEDPVVITHDDQDANIKIEKFRKSNDRWILSVRKISEGVDIKRLRVLVIASHPSTELLFRQLVGRIVRVEDKTVQEDATVYMAKFPQLVQFASRISEEAQAGLRKKKEIKSSGERITGSQPFTIIGDEHHDGGGVSSLGEQYVPSEIEYAEILKSGDRHLANVSVAAIAHLLRKTGHAAPDQEHVDEPAAVQKNKKRRKLNNLVNRAAYLLMVQRQSTKPDFQGVWMQLHAALGISSMNDLVNNHDIAKMDAAVDLVANLLTRLDHAA